MSRERKWLWPGVLFIVSAFSVGPLFAGKMFDVTGSYQIVFIVCAGLTALAQALSLFLKPVAAAEKEGR